MQLTKAIIIGGIAGIIVPFAIGGTSAPVARLVGTMLIHGPGGISVPWSWSTFCVVTLSAWGLLSAAR